MSSPTTTILWAIGVWALSWACTFTSTLDWAFYVPFPLLVLAIYVYNPLATGILPIEEVPLQIARISPTPRRFNLAIRSYDDPRYSVNLFHLPCTYDSPAADSSAAPVKLDIALRVEVSCFYTSDHLGSTREFISTTGAITSRLSYDVYGRTTVVSGTTLPTFQYAGYYNHSTSGLYLTKYRAYDPNTGKWINRDPIAEQGGLNLYGYCSNSPVNKTDEVGLDPTPTPTPTPNAVQQLIDPGTPKVKVLNIQDNGDHGTTGSRG